MTVEPVEPLELKGKREPVPAFRLVAVDLTADAFARHLDAPLVGRVRERAAPGDFEAPSSERACHLFTLLGPAGVGNRGSSRSSWRLRSHADVLRARCLHYGDDITYWPLVEILLAIGVEPDAVIGSSPAETQLAFRKLLEARAADRPQIVVLDDIQWAEPVFLDLIEHIADWSRDAPIFLLCVARPDLLEERPGWGGGKLNATTILLEPLPAEDCQALLDTLAAARPRPRHSAAHPRARGRQPALPRGDGLDGRRGGRQARSPFPRRSRRCFRPASTGWRRGARRDRARLRRGPGVPPGRGAGARSGRGPRAASRAPSDARAQGRDPADQPTFADDDAFRFRHLLIRDAAYDSLPKETRAELHERFADWLERHGALVEQDEIVGYHLEQAHRNRAELDLLDPRLPEGSSRVGRPSGWRGRREEHVSARRLGRGTRACSIVRWPSCPKATRCDWHSLIQLAWPLNNLGRTEDAPRAAARGAGGVERSAIPRRSAAWSPT